MLLGVSRGISREHESRGGGGGGKSPSEWAPTHRLKSEKKKRIEKGVVSTRIASGPG